MKNETITSRATAIKFQDLSFLIIYLLLFFIGISARREKNFRKKRPTPTGRCGYTKVRSAPLTDAAGKSEALGLFFHYPIGQYADFFDLDFDHVTGG